MVVGVSGQVAGQPQAILQQGGEVDSVKATGGKITAVERKNGGQRVECLEGVRIAHRGQEGSQGSGVPLTKGNSGGQIKRMLKAIKVTDQDGQDRAEEAGTRLLKRSSLSL